MTHVTGVLAQFGDCMQKPEKPHYEAIKRVLDPEWETVTWSHYGGPTNKTEFNWWSVPQTGPRPTDPRRRVVRSFLMSPAGYVCGDQETHLHCTLYR